MAAELRKVPTAKLRALGVNERWLQDRIEEDPSILGLGDLQLLRRERAQSSGGRLDFLLYDPELDTRFVVEVMLGAVDESHIIRTLEYWDLERQRYPTQDYRAVIVAEEITSRFYNVIRLLNRAVPLIALQLVAFQIDKDQIAIHAIKVLDIFQEADPVEDMPSDQVDRRYWEKRTTAASLEALDKVIALVSTEISSARVTYNKNHIALGTGGRNFCWFHPKKVATHCHVRVRCTEETREAEILPFEETGLYVRPFQRDLITLKLSAKDIVAHHAILLTLLKNCESASRTED